jgi:hypothetical protein
MAAPLPAREFGIALNKFIKNETPKRVSALARRIELEALKGIVQKTPVDTGRARGNWQVTEGSPAAGTLESVDRSGGPTISKGTGEILAAKPFGKIWITNNLPYIGVLEDGSSLQAPAGMVALTLVEIQARFS